MTQKIYSKQVLLAELEVTYGVDPGLVAANAMLMSNASIGPMEMTQEKRQRAYPNFGADIDSIAQKYQTLSFDIEAAGSGVAGTAPLYDALMQACGLSSTNNVGVSQVYAPISSAQPSASLYFFLDGLKKKLLGSRGNLKLAIAGGKLPQWSFAITGLYADAADVAAPVGTAAQLENFRNGVESNDANTLFTLGGISTVIEKFDFDMGNTVIFRDRPNAAYVAMTDRKATGSVTFEATTVAVEDWEAAIAAGTTLALSLTQGAVGGNKVLLAAPKVQLLKPSYSNVNGIAHMTIPLSFVRTAGDDEFSITIE